MATESPIRMLETSGKWPSHNRAAKFAPSSVNMATEELGLLLKGHRLPKGRDTIPNRSGSAPPSMGGSVAAIENLISQQHTGLNASLGGLDYTGQYASEEQMRADPAYLAYYCSNVNLNPRLPPPLLSSENRRLVRHIDSFGNNMRLTSFDDNSNRTLRLSRETLPTHKEEPEEDRSPQRPTDDWLERSNIFWSKEEAHSLSGPRKSLVELIQEDFPRTPSPVYNNPRATSHGSTEEAVDNDANSNSLHEPSISMKETLEMNASCTSLSTVTSSMVADDMGHSSNIDLSTTQVSNSYSPNPEGSIPTPYRGDVNSTETQFADETLVRGVSESDLTSLKSEMRALKLSSSPTSGNYKSQEQWQHMHHSNLLPQQVRQQQTNNFQVQAAQSHMTSQGVNNVYGVGEHFPQGPFKFSTAEMPPVLQTSGFTPPLYATAAYMSSTNPYYPNLQAPGLFSPQYGVSGYTLNSTVLTPLVAGYPHHGAIPFAFDGTAGPSFDARSPGVSAGGSITQGVEMQHLNKFYGQLGFAMQPSYPDPLYMQYLQQPYGDTYNASGPFDPPLPSRTGVIGSQGCAFEQKGSSFATNSADQKPQHSRSGGISNLNPRRGGIGGPGYVGSPANMGILMQFPTSPLASPVLPGSPVGGVSLPAGRSDMRFSPGFGRHTGAYSGWQGQRGFERFDDSKTYSFLEELKSGKGRRFELSDISGHIVEFSADQHGSRFIQQKLESCSVEEKASVFKEVLPHASKLMTDVFGNYVIQKFFEYGTREQRKELANQLTGQILPLSLQMYGCRVIQKALDVIELDQKTQLVRELDGHVMRCVRDQNGNHVIQKCIESIPSENIGFIISAFRGQVATLSTHPYGCRVIQRVLEHCTDELQSQFIVDEILESVCALAQDQYGNYVTQHVLERGKPQERSQIINRLSGHIVQMSQHKFASNVVEKCLQHGDAAERELLIEEVVGQNEGNDNLLIMMKDQFANYVVQKILETCTESQREKLLSRIRGHLHALKKYTYGKHIVARFEQLFGEAIAPEVRDESPGVKAEVLNLVIA
ncbi:Pumilio RNA-binding repeat [Dillenia turbinata]|uniref:Pumilio RNA-binding repeat n=1 Tax=Dillenia turbinata TaxID=194707 RepID=A0AAN8ZNU1_9MAGN